MAFMRSSVRSRSTPPRGRMSQGGELALQAGWGGSIPLASTISYLGGGFRHPRILRPVTPAPLRVLGCPLGSGRPSLALLQGSLSFEGGALVGVRAVEGSRNPRPVLGRVPASPFDFTVVLAQPPGRIGCAANVEKPRQGSASLADSRFLTLDDVDPPHGGIVYPGFAGVAQSVERQLPKLDVEGSSPFARSKPSGPWLRW